AAKAVAYSTGAVPVAVSAFDLIAMNSSPGDGAYLFPVRDARRGQVYGALFEFRGGVARRGIEDFAATPEEAARRAPAGSVVVGDGVRAYPETLGPPRFRPGPESWSVPRAAVLVRLAAERIARGETTTIDRLAPRYLQQSEPERR